MSAATTPTTRPLAWFTDAELAACVALVGRPLVWVTEAELASELKRRSKKEI